MKTVAIVGSRDFHDLERVRATVAALPKGTRVVSGGARGVDRAAENEARRLGYDFTPIPPDYKTYGPMRAPHIRNGVIAKVCDEMDAFCAPCRLPKCHGKPAHITHGTQSAIDHAEAQGKPVRRHL